jgi:hypothetical protein
MHDFSQMGDVTLDFSPFHAAMLDGLDRVFKFLPAGPFRFTANGEDFETTQAEALALSPKVCEHLRSTPLNAVFEFPSGSIESNHFRLFLEFVRSRDCASLPRDRALMFLSISERVGNESLSLALLSSLNSDSISTSTIGSGPNSAVKNGPLSVANIDCCASQFFLYSIDQLQCLDGRTLHRLLSSESLAIESEDSLLQTLLDLRLDRREFFHYIEIQFLSDDGIRRLLEELDFNQLTEAIWVKIVAKLISHESEQKRKNRYFTLFKSTIMKTIPSILGEFHSAWKLLYRGSRDGFGASAFHSKCNGQSNTLTLIETTKGYIFGGFTPVAWGDGNDYKADSTQTSFLFTVKNPRGTEGRKFPITNTARAIWSGPLCGPVFGGNHDLIVYDPFNSTSNYTNLGGAYRNDTGLDGKQVFTGEYNYAVKEIEVFSVHTK